MYQKLTEISGNLTDAFMTVKSCIKLLGILIPEFETAKDQELAYMLLAILKTADRTLAEVDEEMEQLIQEQFAIEHSSGFSS